MRRKEIDLLAKRSSRFSKDLSVAYIAGCLPFGRVTAFITIACALLSLGSQARPLASARFAGSPTDTDRQQKSLNIGQLSSSSYGRAKTASNTTDHEIAVGPDQGTVINVAASSGSTARPQSANELIVRKMNSGIATDANEPTAESAAKAGVEGSAVLHELKGQVKDATTGQPIVGAVVKLARSSFGILTDDKGCFTLRNAPAKSTLVVKYIGYQPKRMKAESDFIIISLDPAAGSQH